jgi:hypothetical protein
MAGEALPALEEVADGACGGQVLELAFEVF